MLLNLLSYIYNYFTSSAQFNILLTVSGILKSNEQYADNRVCRNNNHNFSAIPPTLADGDPFIIPYKVVNRRFTTLFGIITGSLPANCSCAGYSCALYGRFVVLVA